ncbi:hypothetical protein SAMN06265221_1562 [Paracoccus laeviglucosivorans]|uniref:Uncharacterized protein n=1 Tax=Paracoccus laeviglucosivorans TaxID=1197861 RepID=A0A521FW32_9RHOB|nr:hypothetical protein SAMN06265221_1562 [Paracoccus laeviglucosivorans]
MEAVKDAAARRVQARMFLTDGPVAGQTPFVQAGIGCSVGVGRIGHHVAADEILGPQIADIGFGRPDRRQIRGSLGPRRTDVHDAVRDRAARFGQQLLDHPLGAVIIPFAEVVMPDLALGVDEVMRGPILVLEGAPDGIVVVDRNRIGDRQVGHGLFDVGKLFLKGEFRGVDADHDQSLILVFLGPGPDIGDGAQAVDAGIGPEIDQHDLALQLLGRQRVRVQPADCPIAMDGPRKPNQSAAAPRPVIIIICLLVSMAGSPLAPNAYEVDTRECRSRVQGLFSMPTEQLAIGAPRAFRNGALWPAVKLKHARHDTFASCASIRRLP